ncbi:hypothetical protein [Citricoccus sp.]|uniref:hypothetical protein n=1 Tax=Citricoccus sp. TaxID=1978372 RepID=UPI0028BE32C6|nr:hypothetical protein [Citricoccus sp.]
MTITWSESGDPWSIVDSSGTALAVGVSGEADEVAGLDMTGGETDTVGAAVALFDVETVGLLVADPLGGSSVVEQPVSNRARTPTVRRERLLCMVRPSGGARG